MAITRHNNNCDGDHCARPDGEVRVYPLGGGANLILCRACWAHENDYRRARQRARGVDPANWPTEDWGAAKVYGGGGGGDHGG